MKGELRVTALGDKRKRGGTIREVSVTIPVRVVEDTLFVGLRQAWVDGEMPNGTRFDLAVGAGLGSKFLTFTYAAVDIVIDVEDLIKELIPVAQAET